MLENSIRILRRRWGIVLVALLAGFLAAAGAFVLVPPVQRSEAAVLFVPGLRQPGIAGETNPLLALGGSVAVVASVIQIAVMDDQTALELEDGGNTADYEVVPDYSENAGPVLLITTEDANGTTSEKTRDALVNAIATRLDDLQDSRQVLPELRVNTVLLTSSPEPEAVHEEQIQVAVAAGAVTSAGLLLLVLLTERRRSRDSRVAKHGLSNDKPSAAGPEPAAGDDQAAPTAETEEARGPDEPEKPGGREVFAGSTRPA